MSQVVGAFMEMRACHYLKKQGLKLLFKNYWTKIGEIDLIMRDQETLSFIEVRYRQWAIYGNALESVTRIKQKKLIKTAEHFLNEYPKYKNHPYRFDVVAFNHDNRGPEWIKNAF